MSYKGFALKEKQATTAKTSKEENKKSKKESSNKTEILNVRIPKDLILELDNLVEQRVFNSRSEAIREFAREYVQSQLHEKNAKGSEQGGEE
ncbi:ribbon-helix-helix protein, CopG family [Candidatus Woesearchaeota archaeon]|nr:ribbon-helix-helix protein, CopG family [Candidatus Woesearchaeota archaeon]